MHEMPSRGRNVMQAGPSAPQTTFAVMLEDLRQWVDLYNTAVVPKQVGLLLHDMCFVQVSVLAVLVLYLVKLLVQATWHSMHLVCWDMRMAR